MAQFISDYVRQRMNSPVQSNQPPVPGVSPDSVPENDAGTNSSNARQARRPESFVRLLAMADSRLKAVDISLVKDLTNAVPRPKPSFLWWGNNTSEWDKMEAAAKDAEKALARLDRVPPSDFRNVNNGGDPQKNKAAMAILRQAVEAQNTLKQAVLEYERLVPAASDAEKRLRENLVLACDRRSGQMLSMAAHFATRADIDGGIKPRDAMRALSLEMHGNKTALEAGWDEADALFQEIDSLEAEGAARPPDFEARVQDLKNRFADLALKLETNLRDQTHTLAATEESAEQRGTLLRDRTPFEPLLKSISDSQERLSLLAAGDLKSVLRPETLVNAIMDFQPLDSALEEIRRHAVDFEPFARAREALAGIKEDITAALLAENGNVPGGDLMDWTSRLDSVFVQFANASANPPNNAVLGRARHMPLVKKLTRALAQAGVTRDQKQKDIWFREVGDVQKMVREMDRSAKPWQTGAYAALAAKGTVGVVSLMECLLRGIPPENVELRNDPAALVNVSVLGSGIANTVLRCEYRDGDGNPAVLVFKSEHEARHGLFGMRLDQLGYPPTTRVVDLNNATAFVADRIGCGGVVVKTKAGCHEGRFGMFMELAPGRSPRSWLRPDPETGMDLSFSLIRELSDNGKLQVARANLHRELCNLEWVDFLSGQGDRHFDNYFIDVDPKTGAVKVTAIDNDTCFGQGQADYRAINAYDRDTGVWTTIDTDRLSTPADVRNFKNSTGINHIPQLTFIDRNTYDKLMRIDHDAYEKQLRINLHEDAWAVASAMHRLYAAIEIAQKLERDGRVVEDWANHRVEGADLRDYCLRESERINRQFGPQGSLVESFYIRDGLALLH